MFYRWYRCVCFSLYCSNKIKWKQSISLTVFLNHIPWLNKLVKIKKVLIMMNFYLDSMLSLSFLTQLWVENNLAFTRVYFNDRMFNSMQRNSIVRFHARGRLKSIKSIKKCISIVNLSIALDLWVIQYFIFKCLLIIAGIVFIWAYYFFIWF